MSLRSSSRLQNRLFPIFPIFTSVSESTNLQSAWESPNTYSVIITITSQRNPGLLGYSFYIFPTANKLAFYEVKKPANVISHQVKNLVQLKNFLLDDKPNQPYEFEPVLKINNKYYQFGNANVYDQAFNLLEEHKYFPQYGRKANKFELNLFDKPYNKADLDSLRKVMLKDTTTLYPFNVFLDYNKWYINKIDKQKKIINFWTRHSFNSPGGYFFGRVTSEITFEINVGITDFLIYPTRSDFSENYFGRNETPVQFNFKQSIDLKKTILTTPLISQPRKVKPESTLL